jgi:CelD/BcsL family acetyltransferase involved in cellulose biosynthesis
VVAMAVGAVPEIVEHGRTGFLIAPGEHATKQMAEAIRRVPELDRATCRAVAEERFPLQRMLDGYAELYGRFALAEPRRSASAGLDEPAPATDVVEAADSLEASRVEVIREDAKLFALAPEWAALWEEDAQVTPFQHPAWLLPWWKQFGPDGVLHAFELREVGTGRLVGLMPTYIFREPDGARRVLLLIGAGTSDYLGGVWSTRFRDAPRRALACTAGVGQEWDAVSLQQLRHGGLLERAAEQAGLSIGEAEPTSLLHLDLELPAKIRANVGRYRRRAALKGPVRFSVAADVADAVAGFELLVRFHSQRWEGRGEAGVLEDPRVLAHHRAAIPALFETGLLRMFQLSLSGDPIGVLYALADPPNRVQRRLYLYLIGFDQQWGALSPGTLLLHEVWTYGREHGFCTLDLLRGGENYKTLWGAHTEPTFALGLSGAATEGHG